MRPRLNLLDNFEEFTHNRADPHAAHHQGLLKVKKNQNSPRDFILVSFLT